jgi:hypothetical protein
MGSRTASLKNTRIVLAIAMSERKRFSRRTISLRRGEISSYIGAKR